MPQLTIEEIKKKKLAIEQLKLVSLAIGERAERDLDKQIERDRIEGRPSFSMHTEKMLDKLITQDARMLELKEMVRILSPIKSTVLILGETGTGKELIARALHGNRNGAFIPINCAAMPFELLESELFGHRRGAFTGADSDREGLFKQANNGTIFLDEIGDMPMQAQSKLLRVLQQKAVRPVGDSMEIEVNTRVVCATHHQDLGKMIKIGQFRLDLYARIKTFTLITIPLRHRREDIKPILDSMDKSKKAYVEIPKQLGENFWNEYPFDMNVRDIESMADQWNVLGKVL